MDNKAIVKTALVVFAPSHKFRILCNFLACTLRIGEVSYQILQIVAVVVIDRDALACRPRPKKNDNASQTAELVAYGRPVVSASLQLAGDQGVVHLARQIYVVGKGVQSKNSNSPFTSLEQHLSDIVTILLWLDTTLISTMIQGDLHTLQDPAVRDMIAMLNPEPVNPPTERAVVYALVHCSLNGVPPTKAEYQQCIAMMRMYTKTFDSMAYDQWKELDDFAMKIDRARGPPRIEWFKIKAESWEFDNKRRIKHPRP